VIFPGSVIFGPKPCNVRFRLTAAGLEFFSMNNSAVTVRASDLHDGTFWTGTLFHRLCADLCRPWRRFHEPCPAHAERGSISPADLGLATVEPPDRGAAWTNCRGAKRLLSLCQTPEEKELLVQFWDWHWNAIFAQGALTDWWNENWRNVQGRRNVPGHRRDLFDSMMWGACQFPALLPQVWLNWLPPERVEPHTMKDRLPFRVDFLTMHRGDTHVIEIDGPSHYSAFLRGSYTPEERVYAQTLAQTEAMIDLGMKVTRIARIHVRDWIKDRRKNESTYGPKFLFLIPFFLTTQNTKIRGGVLMPAGMTAPALAPAGADFPSPDPRLLRP
jgi:hypothetical protein